MAGACAHLRRGVRRVSYRPPADPTSGGHLDVRDHRRDGNRRSRHDGAHVPTGTGPRAGTGAAVRVVHGRGDGATETETSSGEKGGQAEGEAESRQEEGEAAGEESQAGEGQEARTPGE